MAYEESIRACWKKNTALKKYFIDLCIKEVNLEGRLGTSLKPLSWNRIGVELDKKFDCKFNQKKLKNQWDYLRRQYVAWSKLMNAAGHGYNATTQNFDWSEEQWVDFIKNVPDASHFRKKSLQFVNELRILFEDALGTENDVTANGPQKDVVPCAKGLKSASRPSIDLGHTVNVDDICPSVPSTSVSEVGATSDAGVQRREKRLKKTTFDDTAIMHEIRDLMHLIVKDQADKGPSVEECLKSLNEFRASHDLPRQLYSTALKAFCQGKDYRVVWMAITDAEDRISFLQSLL